VKRIQICFIRTDGTQVDTLRVIEIASVAETKEGALQRLSKAIGQWIQNTDEGRRAWAGSREDFNIGDLAGYLNRTGKATSALQRCLEKEGIARVKDLFVLTNAEQESYDLILANVEEK